MARQRAYSGGIQGATTTLVEFRILGPLEVFDGGTQVRLGGRNQRALLALLLLNAGDVISTDRLIDGLWGEEPPRTASTSLQNAVSQLRKLLGADRIVTKPPGYLVRLEGDELDTARVLELVATARASDAEARVGGLREAEALWHGPPLADFAFDAFAQSAIARLEELRLGVVEERIDAELELGRHADAASELEALLAENPLRERLRSQLMIALYRSGRQADALRIYQEGRRVLVDELGIDPSPSLQRLHGAILRQDRGLDQVVVEPTAEESIEEIAIALLEGRLVPVLGTEVGELAHRLAERFRFPADGGTELTRVAEYVALMKGSGPLYDELHELLSARAVPTSIHRSLASLAPVLRERGAGHQLLVTTGYDLALEQAFLDAGEEFDVVSYLASGRDGGKFCHFAPDGAVRVVEVPNRYATELDLRRADGDPEASRQRRSSPERAWESFVVTEDDYLDYLPERDLAAAIPVALAAHLRRSHFLFLGYAMQDWNLRLVLNRFWGGAASQLSLLGGRAGMPRSSGRSGGAGTSTCSTSGSRTSWTRSLAAPASRSRRRDDRRATARVEPVQGSRSLRGQRARRTSLLRARARHRHDRGEPDGVPLHGPLWAVGRREELRPSGRRRSQATVGGRRCRGRRQRLVGGRSDARACTRSRQPTRCRAAAWGRPLVDALAIMTSRFAGDVYLIFDQFEELFVYPKAEGFAASLAEVVKAKHLRVNVLLALREDALAELDVFTGRIPNVFGNYLSLERLDRAAARDAVLGPLARYNELSDRDLRSSRSSSRPSSTRCRPVASASTAARWAHS